MCVPLTPCAETLMSNDLQENPKHSVIAHLSLSAEMK